MQRKNKSSNNDELEDYDSIFIEEFNNLAFYISKNNLACKICGEDIDFLVEDVAYYCRKCNIVFHKKCFELKYGKDADLMCPVCKNELEIASPMQ
jgi:Zn finger protein HypA/HybF involved in hydrogenase expression